MELLYNGLLDERTVEAIKDMLSGLPHVVEITTDKMDWDKFHEWQNNECPKYPVERRNSSGSYISDYRTAHGSVKKYFFDDTDNVSFFFFKSKAEKEGFVETFSDCVISDKPFITKFTIKENVTKKLLDAFS